MRRVKKGLVTLAFAFVMLGAVSSKASAAEIVSSGNCGVEGDNVTWTLDDEGVLTISGSGEMGEFSSEFNNDTITKCVIEEGVTSINSFAFCGFDEMKSIAIADTVTSISENAFYSCKSLETVDFPANLTRLGKKAFFACFALKSVVIPEGVTCIEPYTFYECTSLEKVTIPDSVTRIGERAFIACRNLLSVEIPEHITYIDSEAFNFTTLLICSPDSWAATAEESVYKEVCVPKEGLSGSAGENITYHFDPYTSTMTFSGSGKVAVYGMPVCSVSIGHVVFENYTSEELPSIIGCSIESIELPKSIKAIPYRALFSCERLKSIEIPENVESLEEGAFLSCVSLESVKLNKGLKTIKENAFKYCFDLHEIEIPETVETIEADVFSSDVIKKIYIYANKNLQIQEDLFADNTEAVSVYGYSNVEKIVKEWKNTNVEFINLCSIGKHVVKIDKAVEPTIHKSGLTEGSHCIECNKVLVEQKVVPPVYTGTNSSNTTVTTEQSTTEQPTTEQPTTEQPTTEIKLATQKITTAKIKKYKAKNLKKKKVTFSLKAKTTGDGKLTYKVSKYPKNGKKYIKVSKRGKVTLKKGCKKGTYKITIKAAKTAKYEAATKVVKIKVK